MKTAEKYIRAWLYTGAGLIFAMVIIGGITRLTGSGLSMSDWNLIMGAVPPTTDEAWTETFEHYQQFPQYQKINKGMSLSEFKSIFFWEYLHRILGRLVGVVFLIPFIIFWLRGFFTPRLFKRMLVLFVLGALQGAMGWIMVKSGLVDNPYVSHYRLAMHFLLAVILIGLCYWYALDIGKYTRHDHTSSRQRIRSASIGVLILFFAQIIWGAFTAGLDAGFMYNTFPLMEGSVLPPNGWSMDPFILNFVENAGTVQWTHRVVGTLLLLAVFGLWLRARRSSHHRVPQRAGVLVGIIIVQYALGISVLLMHVPVALGVLHQAIAIVFWLAWLSFYQALLRPAKAVVPGMSRSQED